MKSSFRVVGGLDFDARHDRDEKRTRAADRKRAAPVHREWMRRIQHHRMAGKLLPIDIMVARELLNYPSSNHGKCYAGRKRIADAIGTNQRTVDRAVERLEACGLLQSRRGGQGKTATRYFCCNGLYVFGGKAFRPLTVSHQDSTPVSHKPSEQRLQPPEQSLPLSPIATPHAESLVLEGEIVSDTMTFADFWIFSGRQGSEGFARSEWRKLSNSEVAEITDFARHTPSTRRTMWSGVFLRDRVWRERPKQEDFRGEVSVVASPRFVHAEPGSELWRLERDRRVAAGESTQRMDHEAQQGRGFTCMVASPPAASAPP